MIGAFDENRYDDFAISMHRPQDMDDASRRE
jgi:hypothetical protein